MLPGAGVGIKGNGRCGKEIWSHLFPVQRWRCLVGPTGGTVVLEVRHLGTSIDSQGVRGRDLAWIGLQEGAFSLWGQLLVS